MSHYLKKNFLWFMIATFSLLTACSDGGSGGLFQNKKDNEEASPTELPPSVSETPKHPIEKTRWCRAEDWESFQVVMRLTAKGDKTELEYLRITPDAPTVYKYSEDYRWEIHKPHDPTDYRKNSITLFQDPVAIQKLTGFEDQKKLVETVLVKNSVLARSSEPFNPPEAITVMTRSLSTGDDVKRNFYPCEAYSPYFNLDGPQRPFMEIVLYFAWVNEGFTGSRSELANQMKLNLPIEEVKVAPNELQGSQWCSWHEVGPQNLLMRSLTFHENKMVHNIHSEHFTTYFDESARNEYLNQNAANSKIYEVSSLDGRLKGQHVPKPGSASQSPVLYSMVQDGSGVRALVFMNAKDPDDTWPSFDEIYYSCADTRPTTFSPAFAAYLAPILDLQRQVLAPLPPPAPEPTPAPPVDPAQPQPEQPQPQPQPTPSGPYPWDPQRQPQP